jgi:hypothetical protein
LSGLGASTMRASHCGQFGRPGSILCPQATEFRFCNAGALGRVPHSISACTALGSSWSSTAPGSRISNQSSRK